jgi:hypothetical protein
VRRSSDSTEQDIGFASNSLLDSAAILSFVGAGDGFVTTWYDQTGNGHNVAQATTTAQPLIVSAGSLLLRGMRPAVRFDGINDCLVSSVNNPFTFTGGLSIAACSYKNATAFKAYETIFSAGTTGSSPSNQARCLALSFGNDALNNNPRPTISTDVWSPSGIQFDGTVSADQRSIVSLHVSNWSSHRAGGLSGLARNGSLLLTKNYGTTPPAGLNTNGIKIGVFDQILASSFFAGDLQEVIAYASDQFPNQLGIDANINAFYGVY